MARCCPARSPPAGSAAPSLYALGYKSPNEKLNIGAVGVGIRGPAILVGAAATENIVALCDVDEERSARGFAEYPNAKKYKDYRKMFESEGRNIDAVMIATPDHMHTPVALLAMHLGKHVYCEKPLTRTPWEAQLLADAAVKYKVATQMGNQGWNHEGTKTACEILWSGEIGDVKELHAWTGGIYGGQPNLPASGPEAMPVPPTLDWDLWLGCAEPRSFNPLMTNQWRAFQDFSTGGSLGDWLVHNLGPAHLALLLDRASPTSVECVYVEGQNQWLWPLRAHVVYEFPARGAMPPVTVHTYQNMRGEFENPPGMAEGERLFPPMNNLTAKGRSFVQGGDGMMLVGTQLTVDGKPIPRQGAPAPPPPGAGRGPGGPGGPGGPAGAPGARPPFPGASSDPKMRAPGNGAIFVGSKGYMATTARGEGVWLLPASRWAEYKLPPQLLQRGINHQQDWIRACKGGAPGVSDFAVATKYIEWLTLGTIALRVPGKLIWDANKRRFANSDQANRLLKPALRRGWELKLQAGAMRTLLITLCLSFAGFAQVQTEVPPVEPTAKAVTVERIKIHGAALEGNLEGNAVDRDAIVYLPPGYSAKKKERYPVVYALHGYSIGAEQWSKEIHTPQVIEGAFAKGAQEMIVVLPDSKTVHNGSMYSSSVTTGDFEQYISRDVVEYIDSHYRTIPKRTSRGLVGHSMGGYGASRIGMKHSDVFGSLYIMSPCCMAARTGGPSNPAMEKALEEVKTPADSAKLDFGQRAQLATAAAWSPNPKNPPLYLDLPSKDGVPQQGVLNRWIANAPLVFVHQYIGNLRQYRAIAIDVGDQDGLRAGTKELHEILDTYGIANSFEIYSGTHTSAVAVRFQNFVMPFFNKHLCAGAGCQ